MKPSLYSYTGPNGTANTTLNDGTNFRCFFTKLPIVPPAQAKRVTRGDAQEPFLAGMQTPGMDIEMTFECLQANPRDGVKILTAMFSNKDRQEKTLVFKDQDDSNRLWSLTCRNKGVSEAKGPKIVTCQVALKSAVALTVNTNTESAWDTTTPTNDYQIGIGNLDAIPIIEISIPAPVGGGQRYCRFVKVRNYTRRMAQQYPIDITDGGLDTSALVNFTGVGLHIVGAINNNPSTVTIPYGSPIGGAAWTSLTLPFMIYRGGEQMRVTARTGGPTYTSGNLTVVRAVNGSTITSHADNAVLALSKAAFDGRDVRVKIGTGAGDLSDAPFWFGTGANAWNQAATKIWTNKTFAVRALGTLASGISDTDTSLTIIGAEGNIDTTNGVLFFSAGTEVTPYVGYSVSTGVVSGLARGERDGIAGSHAAGETVYFIEDMWLYYGSSSSTAPTYETDPVYLAKKPSFALTSTNSQWTYNAFASSAANNPYEWKPAPGTGICFTQDASGTAPFTNPAPADPVTDIGVAAIAKNAMPYWRVITPFGLASFVATTIKRINTPTNQSWLESSDGTKSPLAGTTVINGWQTIASQTLTPATTSYFAQLTLFNNTTANWTRWAAVSIASATINLSTATTSAYAGVPYISMGAEQTVDIDVDTTIGNSTTGESIQIKFPNLAVGKKIIINCLAHTITYTKGNINAYSTLQPYPARENWLRLIQGTNTMTCLQPGLSVVIKEQYRNEGLA